ncbi:MAG: hypothetical protein LBK44_03535 [Spirochaetales bacterium]|jgi:hypothetical protein|nr:hypothetical protein [Spirochaetales bacterium]
MSVTLSVVGIITGIAVAWVLNKILSGRIENKKYRVGLKITAYIVCVILGVSFAVIGSLRTLMNNFIKDRIEFIEIKLSEISPDSNILETSINTSELSSVIPELLQLVNDIDTDDNDVFERIILDAFEDTLTIYANTIEDGINRIAMPADNNGQVTVKSILYELKDMALETISPYFILGQIGIVFLLIVFIGIYIGIIIFLKRGGAMYNKSISFGEIAHSKPPERDRNID